MGIYDVLKEFIASFVKEFLKNDKINLLEISVVLLITLTALDNMNVFKIIENSYLYIFIKFVQVCSLTYFLIKLIEYIYKKYKVVCNLKKNQNILLSLGNNELNILALFYNFDINKFNDEALIHPTTMGIENLERYKIISFNGILDENGGYSIKIKQPYFLEEKYKIALDKLFETHKENNVKNYILMKRRCNK